MSVERMRPLLGTFVAIRVESLPHAAAIAAIEGAFAEIAAVHRCMSFHAQDSDLARLQRARAGTPVRVDARTHAVLDAALRIAVASDGCFDPTIAARQVAWGFLPRPESCAEPDPRATWRDIELLDRGYVRLRRPLWLDLGGIAKGYAVDRAVERLAAAGATQVCVNAGGDLRVAGARAEIVRVRDGALAATAFVELTDGALATSSGYALRRRDGMRWRSVHVDGRSGEAADPALTATVAAPSCMVADALTKVVLAGEATLAARVLAQFGAQAFVSPVSPAAQPSAAA